MTLDEVIPSALAGERLDRVVSLVTGASRADAAVLVRAGGALVDGTVVTSGKIRLTEGQRVEIDPALLPVEARPQPDASVEMAVLHEDADLLVIDKPAGLVVHPGAGNNDGTLVNGLLARWPAIAGVGDPMRPGIVHRLDVGTSGVLAVAKTQVAYERMVEALSQRRVGRIYRALVWGHPESPRGVIDAPVGRDIRDPMRMAVVVDGRPARTHFRSLATFRDLAEVAELECRLETGRTHQIRVHLAAVGHPVVGDPTYGGVRSPIAAPRPMLHAIELSLDHPVTGESMRVEAALPADFVSIRASLGDATSV